jgi:hypothetical protein
MKTNKIYPTIALLLMTCLSYSQDKIFKINGETIDSKIEEINVNDIKYRKFENLNGPIYTIEKKELRQIKFENGTIESFPQENLKNEISIEETKDFIVKQINEHGFEEDSFNNRYKASFEGDYLRLIVLRKNNEEANGGILFDFSNVYKFQNVSVRSNNLAFVNIFVSILKNKKQNKWDKHKLIMRVDNSLIAESILNALKHYNELLIETKKIDSKF